MAFSNKDLRAASVFEGLNVDGEMVPSIKITLTPDAAKELEKFTKRLIPPARAVPVGSKESKLVILIDGKVLVDAYIREPLSSGTCFISHGLETIADAQHTARGITGH